MNKISRFKILAEGDPLIFNLVETAAVLNSRFSEMFGNDIVHSARESQDWLQALFNRRTVDNFSGVQYCTDVTGPVFLFYDSDVLKVLYGGVLKESSVHFQKSASIKSGDKGLIVESSNDKDLGFISDILEPYCLAIQEKNISKITGPLLQQALNLQLCVSGKLHGGYIYKFPVKKHFTCKMLIGN